MKVFGEGAAGVGVAERLVGVLGLDREVAAQVDPQQRLVARRIEGFGGRHHLAPEQPGQPPGIKVAAFKGLVAELCPQRRHEPRIGAAIRRALAVATSRGLMRVLDVNLRRPFFDAALIRESVAAASVLKLSDDELAEVLIACDIARGLDTTAALRAPLVRHHLDLIALTRGAAGALLVTADEVIDQPGISTVVRDTVGAGDSFTAALVVGRLRGDAPRAAQVPTVLRGVEVVNERFLTNARRSGVPVHVWTINERNEMERLLDLGVDGIMTDETGLLRTVMIERGVWPAG